jgi:hypothetical protein
MTSSFAQTTIPDTAALPASAADTSKPGFLWRVHQVGSGQPNTVARAEAQLSGLLGDNIADPGAQGAADAAGTAPSPANAPIEFPVSNLINFDQAGGSNGNFTPDEQMPGIPGTGGGTDNIAAEVLTWLDLPAGEVAMGVNSDDGFRVLIGGANPSDKFGTPVGEFDGGRGAADTIFRFTLPKAGLYAARLVWFEGGGGANVEWFTQKADGTKVLVNDSANGGVKAYRAISGGAAVAVVSSVSPNINQTGVAPNAKISASLEDGSSPIDAATVKLSLDGTPLNVTATKNGSVTTITYTPPSFYAQASKHTASLSYTEGGVTKTKTWNFQVANYGILPASAKVTPDTSKPGFVWNVFANSAATATTNQRTEDALAGLLKDTDGNLLPNNADPAAKGVALANAAAPNPANAPIHFEIDTVINLDQAGGSSSGNFTPDEQMPGVPATDGSTDGIAAEIITYIDLPAGVATMGVNSDDGFRTVAGNALDVFGSIFLGEFDAGRGAADTIFSFVVQEAGVYAFRTIWNEGGGGANIEWFTVKEDGTKVLLNDTAKGGFKTYRALVGGTPPYIKSVTPGPVPRQINQPVSAVTLILVDGSATVDENSIALKIDGKPATISKARSGNSVNVTFTPTELFLPDQKHNAEISYKDSAGNNRTQQWTLRNVRNLVLPAPKVTENFDSYPEGSVPTGWTAINFTDTGTAGEDLDDLNSDSYKGWIVVSRSRVESLKSRIFNTPTGLFFNGQEITTDTLSGGNLLYAESDVRGGNQVQFITTKAFDLSAITNVLVSFSSLYEQNQDSTGTLEYSVDGGTTWKPVVIYIDIADGSGSDVKYNPDGTVDAVATLTGTNADTANWTDNGVAKGDKYGDALLTPITQALGDYIAPRINDNNTIDKRIEVFALPEAGRKSDVRLRFAQLGTGSWYFGVDNLAFYESPIIPASVGGDQPSLTIAKAANNQITLSWTGGTGPFLVQKKSSLADAAWANVVTTANRSVDVANVGQAAFFRIQDGAAATVQQFQAILNGANERPTPVDTTATGVGTFSLEGNTLTYDIVYSGLSSAASAGHIHGPADANSAADVLIGFSPGPTGTSGRLTGTLTLNDAQKAHVVGGMTYANIHTGNFGGGEIRGQILAK